jgi:hypothetical protein
LLKTGLATRQVPFTYQPLHDYDLQTVTIGGKRFYDVDGEYLPSVTTVLSSLSKEGIEEWRKKVGEEKAEQIMRAAANRGTLAHKMWEEYLRNDPNYGVGVMPTSILLFKQLQPWLDRNIDFLYGNEIPLFSKSLRTAGRCDAVASVNGRPAIIDFKTSSKVKKQEYIKNYYLQCTVYSMMVEEMYGIVVEDAYILIAVEGDKPQSFPFKTKKYKEEVREIFTNFKSFS